MTSHRNWTIGLLAAALIAVGFAGAARAGEERPKVVADADIQAQIDQRLDTERADRQAIQDLLARPDVRKVAGTAGIDLERAKTAAGVLSGDDLANVAAQAHALNGGVGGVERVTLTVTTIIIVLLLIIILAS